MASPSDDFNLSPAPSLPPVFGVSLAGSRLAHFQLEQRLGGGASSTVYRASDIRTGTPVALKLLLPDADEITRERFRLEVRTHSTLFHPNIVRILDTGYVEVGREGIAYLAMELVDGPSLPDLLDRTGRIPWQDAARLLQPVAVALAYAHRQGVIHRDVKPSNILLRVLAEGSPLGVAISLLPSPVIPLLSDYGIALAMDAPELTNAGRTIGTPLYMSPEQCADSHEVDGRADIYSLGAVLYRMLVGRPPFGGTTTQVLHAHVYEPLLLPDEVAALLPAGLLEILRRSLAKQPAQRFATAEEMARALGALTAGQTSVAVRPPLEPEEETGATTTMPSLHAVRPPTTSHVLIPAPPVGSGGLVPAPVAASVALSTPAPLNLAGQAVESSGLRSSVRPPVRPLKRRWFGLVLGVALLFVIGLGGLQIVRMLMPEELASYPGTATTLPATPTPATPTGAASTASATAPGVATAVAVVLVTPEPDAGPSPAATGTPTAAAGVGPTPVPPSPTPVATPAGDIEEYWSDAQSFFLERDWSSALDFLNLVQRIDPGWESTTVTTMLVEIHAALGAKALAAGQVMAASDEFSAVLALQPGNQTIGELIVRMEDFMSPFNAPNVAARQALQGSLMRYADRLTDAEKVCLAAEMLAAAVTLLPDSESAYRLYEARAACLKQDQDRLVIDALEALSGTIIYSAQLGERVRVMDAQPRQGASSALVIEDARQPAPRRSGTAIAYYNTRPGEEGLWVFEREGLVEPVQRGQRVSEFVEDGYDSPASWSVAGDRLVFASTAAGDRRSRIYGVWYGDPASVTALALGKEPAYHPYLDRIVYNGTNDSGNEPGLWVMNGDGSGRVRVTDNGNDSRPVWTPDGANIVFMSTREGNWELYRVRLKDGAVFRLTDDVRAQDGLPAVSPDGEFVAFASDRGGQWRIWLVPLRGGTARLLLEISGEFTNWLEHSIQWIP
jgi:serine/threonine-protein kinase